MVLLERENGSSIIESLVVILLLGILVLFTSLFFNRLFNNYNLVRYEALQIAQLEIVKCIDQSAVNDTFYVSELSKFKISRIVLNDSNVTRVEVIISRIHDGNQIISLKTVYPK